MKKIVTFALFVILLSSFASAEIIINAQPKESYSLGNTIVIPIIVKSVTPISGTFNMDLICNGHQVNFYKNGISLSSGEEKQIEPSLVLTKEVIGEVKGNCVVKAILGEDYVLSNEFQISDIIGLRITSEQNEFAPGQPLTLIGEALKEGEKEVNGFIELQLIQGNDSGSFHQISTIRNGFFEINITLPETMKAGIYLLKLNAYEKDTTEVITNQGFLDYNVLITQTASSLEIFFENQEVEPGTNLQVKTILHDQTGENIPTSSFLTIKDNKDKILEEIEIATDEFLEFPIAYNQAPETWTIIASSGELTSESVFSIGIKKEVKAEIVNKTVLLTNMGNVPYNDNVLVKIGESPLNINVSLEVDESQKYILSAPDGEYQVEIMGLTENIPLTGKTIDVKKASGGVGSLIRYPFVWIFIIIVLGFVVFTIYRKGYKRSFIGKIHLKKRKKKDSQTIALPLRKSSKIKTKNKAELSLSIKGDKQDVSLVCIHIKELKDAESKKGNAEETLQKAIDLAEEHKAVVYENQGNIFFIFAPLKTKTFRNEKNALEFAQKIKSILDHHNKLFKQKISFGMSLNHGSIIAKQEREIFKFMSMGTLITGAKKIASIAHNEILLSEKINDKLRTEVKTQKSKKHRVDVFSITQIKRKSKEHEQFLKHFLKRIEGKE